MDSLATINYRRTEQTVQADPRQVENSAGGYTFTVDDTTRLRRFLVLGTDGGTYYASERDITKANADVVMRWARDKGTELVGEVVAISTAGRAPRQNPALFALAAAASFADLEGRRAAFAALPAVARTSTHLFLFARYVEQFRGWGRGLRRAVANWYTSREVDSLAYQAVKYRQREGWTHRDLLRLSHPVTADPARADLFDWICGRAPDTTPDIVGAFERVQATNKTAEWLDAITAWPSLSWEMLPDAALNSPAVWEALIGNGMPQTALMRQLPRLTRLGVVKPLSSTTKTVAAQLADPEALRRARVHPVNALVALRTYASGVSARGTGEWKPVGQIVDALDAAFYASFGAIRPAGKKTLLALDVSGSMTSPVSGLPISCREASAALAMATAATEPEYAVVGFTAEYTQRGGFFSGYSYGATAITSLSISPRQRLDSVLSTISGLPFGGTDCALPITWATQNRVEVETFAIFTDNETYAGSIHPHQALRDYRQETGIDARLVVVGMTATDFTIADPTDAGMLDIAGFDSAVPNLLSDFSAGSV